MHPCGIVHCLPICLMVTAVVHKLCIGGLKLFIKDLNLLLICSTDETGPVDSNCLPLELFVVEGAT